MTLGPLSLLRPTALCHILGECQEVEGWSSVFLSLFSTLENAPLTEQETGRSVTEAAHQAVRLAFQTWAKKCQFSLVFSLRTLGIDLSFPDFPERPQCVLQNGVRLT